MTTVHKIGSFFLLLMLLCPSVTLSQENFLRVTAQGNRQFRLSIPPSISMNGAHHPETALQISQILSFDLGITGLFIISQPTVVELQPGIRPGEFDLSQWKNTETDLLLKTGYYYSGETVTLEFRLYEPSTGRELLAKRYSAAIGELRRTAHTFSDDVLQTLTGERGPFSARIAYVSKATGNKEISVMDWDGYNSQNVTRNGSINLNPEFSPSGREIIYTSYKKNNPDLYRRELFSGVEARISSHPGINITGAYSPDGNRIALAMSKDGNSEIYVISKEGKQLSRLTNHPGIDVSPAWSPDGRTIAFVSDRHGKPQVFVMTAEGSTPKRLTTSGSYNVSPRWSPKGDRIVYCRQYGNGMQIHVINPDGSDDRQLTSTGSNEHPRWSPDGRLLVFSSTRDGSEAIYVMRSDGTGQTRISRNKAGDSHPTWAAR